MQHEVLGNWWAHFGIFALAIVGGVMGMLIMLIWFDRRYWARFQIRVGPNRCGPWGLLQVPADGLKMVLKEDIMPDKADKVLHVLAPILVFFPVLMAFAVIPFASARGGLVPELNIGVLYIVGITGVVALGLLTTGWASSNKYALIGGMRAVATVVSYEFPVVLALIGVGMMAGTLSIAGIVEAQEQTGWFIVTQPLGFLVFFIGVMAECGRSPFDYVECESEMGCGVNTEYSGLRFGVFQMTEWAEAVFMSCLVTTLFLGGYSYPGSVYLDGEWSWLGTLLGLVAFMVKVVVMYLVLGWIKCTMPGRLRIDQWMGFAWKALLPLAVINLAIVAVEVVAWGNGAVFPAWAIAVNAPLCVVLVLLWSRLWTTGGGRVDVRAVR